MTGRVKVTLDKTADVLRALAAIGRDRAYVGFPDSGAGHDGGHLTNAQLGYIHETGAPEANIPARPFLAPAAEGVKDEVVKRLKAAGEAALNGKPEVVTKTLAAVGLLGQNAARAKINSGVGPALKESTLASRRRRGRKGTKQLIDTGALRNAITFVVRPKEGS